MVTVRRLLLVAATLAALQSTWALGAFASSPAGITGAVKRALLSSPELWATINVCNAADQPNTVGVRGAMPGDGQAHDKMYMSFALQYRGASTANRWVDLAGAKTSWIAVGSGSAARQSGSSFTLVPVSGRRASKFRGVVDFQWRRGTTVLLAVSRPTTAPHKSLAGADPAGFSSATCLIG